MVKRVRNLEQIIEDQVRVWDYQHAGRHRSGRPTIWPVITISREYATPGDQLAAELGKRTGFVVWDREILQEIAKETGGDEKILQSLDEHRRRAIEDAVRGALLGSAPTHYQYLRALMRVVRTIAAHGSVIIVGRGAHYIVEPSMAVRVRLVCPLDVRVRQYARTNQISEHQAYRKITHIDAERIDFIRYHFRRKNNARDFDIVLNSDSFCVEKLADLVLAAYEAKVGCRPPETRETEPGRAEPQQQEWMSEITD